MRDSQLVEAVSISMYLDAVHSVVSRFAAFSLSGFARADTPPSNQAGHSIEFWI